MSMRALLYDGTMRVLRRTLPFVSHGSSKLAEGVRGRWQTEGALHEWARVYRDRDRPLAWFHAPSVGEGLQARAILEALLELRPELQVAYTFFSPSAVSLARKMPVHVAGYLPWDIYSEMSELLETLQPGLIVFTKTEAWPGVVRAAKESDVPVVLTAATLPAEAGRLRFPARGFLEPTFSALDRVFAISEEDGSRFARLGVSADRVEVTGDPGIDSAWQRSREANPQALYLAPFRDHGAPTLVAGSTWGPDEEVLIPALRKLRERVVDLRVVIAPHEPSERHLAGLRSRLEADGRHVATLSEVEAAGTLEAVDVVLVDRVGVLAHLYTIGNVAYVGGGFHKQGLHSVLEPAAAGLPTVIGPAHGNSRAADELIRVGAVRVGSDDGELREALSGWLLDRRSWEEASGRALGYIEAHGGAAERTARALEEMLPRQ